jgi:acyl-coenzyme A synthetase/AMP-(fatty) acid ligase
MAIPERYVKQYWSKWTPDVYLAGDGRKLDADGLLLAARTC